MYIRATPEQMKRFGIEIEGSKIIRKGRSGKLEGDTGTFAISDVVFDFSRKSQDSNEGMLEYHPRKISMGDTKIIFSAPVDTKPHNLYDFPNAIHVSLKYFTPQTKSRADVLGEYQVGDYFELEITNQDGSKKKYYLESDLSIH